MIKRYLRLAIATVLVSATLTVANPQRADAAPLIQWGPGNSNTVRTYVFSIAPEAVPICGRDFPIKVTVQFSLGTVTGSSAYVRWVKYTFNLKNGAVWISRLDAYDNVGYKTVYAGEGFGTSQATNGKYWGANLNRTFYDGSGYMVFELYSKFNNACPTYMAIRAISTSWTPS